MDASRAADLLSRHAAALYDDARLTPMLTQLIKTSCHLADAMGGSISLVDGADGCYTKVAEIGTSCRLGQRFPLSEGVTGQVLRQRAPVVLRTYRELGTGHLKAGPAADGAVAAIPVWWRADIVAVNVVFAGVARPFTLGEVDHLELVTQIVAAGLVSAVDRELSPPAASRPAAEPRAVAGAAAITSVDDVVTGLIDVTRRTVGAEATAAGGLELRILRDEARPRLLFRPECARAVRGSDQLPWRELVDGPGGAVEVRGVERVEPRATAGPGHAGRERSPFSAREQEVAELLVRGLSDRAIASVLFLSPKTVEKHVSSVLRKTGTVSRTAAAVCCLEQGWIPSSSGA